MQIENKFTIDYSKGDSQQNSPNWLFILFLLVMAASFFALAFFVASGIYRSVFLIISASFYGGFTWRLIR